MTDIITSIKYDEKDPKFIQIKNEFTAEIQKRFSCDNYEDITKYVFGEVFQKQHSKETCIKELESIFNDKTEEIINYLWNLVDRVVNEHEDNNNAKGDVLDKIFKDDNIGYETQLEFEIMYDLASDRITIPIRDELGTLVGVKGRSIVNDPDVDKYIYLEPCAKTKVLYGLYKTLPYINV